VVGSVIEFIRNSQYVPGFEYAVPLVHPLSQGNRYLARKGRAQELKLRSLERIQEHTNIEQEPKPTPEGTPPAHWPASRELIVENLSARYSADGPEILHDLSFHNRSSEHVGVASRTGSGKSSLTLHYSDASSWREM